MIIYGYRRGAAVDLGPALPRHCPNCNKTEFWHLYEATTWFTLFWIRIFPYRRDRFLSCPLCERGFGLRGPGIGYVRDLVALSTALAAGAMTQDAYVIRMKGSPMLRANGDLNWDYVKLSPLSSATRPLVALICFAIGFVGAAWLLSLAFPRGLSGNEPFFDLVVALLIGLGAYWITGRRERSLRKSLNST